MAEQVGSFVQFRPLQEALSGVKDPRRAQGRRHPLAAILSMACGAMLCGCRTYGAIAEWGRLHSGELMQALGFTRQKTPAVSTLFDVLSRLDREQLEGVLSEWSEQVMAATAAAGAGEKPQEGPSAGREPTEVAAANTAPTKATPTEGVAIDGKTLRGSRKQEAPGVHLLSAFSHRLGLTLGQVAVDDKTNEIPAAHDLLKGLLLEGRVVTVDALLTQKQLALSIREKGGTM